MVSVAQRTGIVFWAVMPCGLVGGYQRFGETSCIHIASQPRRPCKTVLFDIVCFCVYICFKFNFKFMNIRCVIQSKLFIVLNDVNPRLHILY
jgi:hypothetical protein